MGPADDLLSRLRGDLHAHTTWSDGRASLAEMAAAAEDLGREYLAVTDHSPRLRVANGLSRERLRAQWDEIERVQAERDLRLRSNEHVIEKLQAELASPTSEEPTENLSKLLLEYQSLVQTIHSAASPSITVLTSTANKAVDIQRQGLRLELEAIQARYEEGALPRFSYKRLRENVMLMQIDLEDNV